MHALVKLGLLLHKRIIKDVLPSDGLLTTSDSLDALANFSAKLMVVFDDLISSLYVPQDASNIKTHLEHFEGAVKDCQAVIIPVKTKTLEEQLGDLSVSDQNRDKTKLWFSTCFSQINKASDSVSEALKTLEIAYV